MIGVCFRSGVKALALALALPLALRSAFSVGGWAVPWVLGVAVAVPAAGFQAYAAAPPVSTEAAAAKGPDVSDPSLLLWLDASDSASLAIDADGRVSAWRNKAAAGGRWTSQGAQRPALVAKAAGDRPAVRLDGVDDVLRNVAFDKTFREATLVIAVTPRSNRGFGLFHALFSANRRGVNDFLSGINVDLGGIETADFSELNVEGIQDAPGVQNQRTDTSPFGEAQVVAVAVGGGRCRLYVGGEAENERPANGAVASLNEVRIGARFYEGRERGSFDGDISEVILYAKDLPAASRSALIAYLTAKYGVRPRRAEAWTLDEAFAQLPKYHWAASRKFAAAIDQSIREAHADASKRLDLEQRLLGVLRAKDATRAAKDFVCRRLGRIGSPSSVEPLASLLSDPELAAPARAALQQIPGEGATAALRKAASNAGGELQAALLHALGTRRDGRSAPWIASLLRSGDAAVARAAAAALAEIAEPTSIDALLALHAEGELSC